LAPNTNWGNSFANNNPVNTICSLRFSQPLRLGFRGPEVRRLQQFLNSFPDTVVASYGDGSRGRETDFFGPATKLAVMKFQRKYAGDILYPNGYMEPTGDWWHATLQKANAIIASECGAIPNSGVTPGQTGYLPNDNSCSLNVHVCGEIERQCAYSLYAYSNNCGTENKTFNNVCELNRVGARLLYYGDCKTTGGYVPPSGNSSIISILNSAQVHVDASARLVSLSFLNNVDINSVNLNDYTPVINGTSFKLVSKSTGGPALGSNYVTVTTKMTTNPSTFLKKTNNAIYLRYKNGTKTNTVFFDYNNGNNAGSCD
jgi:peptidoglycan hydrolase-like protein with peptidoglycan-binding domain